jgi:hypothetical protein
LLRNVAASLRSGGVFVIEAFVPDLTRFDRGQRVQLDSISGEDTRFTVALHDQASQRIRNRHIVTRAGRSVIYPVEIRYAWPAELDLMAQLAGLRPLGRWGGWLGQPFTSGSSSHVSAWTAPG